MKERKKEEAKAQSIKETKNGHVPSPPQKGAVNSLKNVGWK